MTDLKPIGWRCRIPILKKYMVSYISNSEKNRKKENLSLIRNRFANFGGLTQEDWSWFVNTNISASGGRLQTAPAFENLMFDTIFAAQADQNLIGVILNHPLFWLSQKKLRTLLIVG